MMMENRMMTGNRVDCLYRVSTDKQVDYNDKSQADIPMQRRECHRFCEKMGWTIVHEEQEDGVSGHKVRAENRDKLQIIKERAKQGKFDILLVFMFDRIGRIADETPFVVEWFVKNGIRVWSTQEGEQRFDNLTRTSSPTTSASGRPTAKAKRLQFAQKPLSASLSRTAVSRAVLLPMGMTL